MNGRGGTTHSQKLPCVARLPSYRLLVPLYIPVYRVPAGGVRAGDQRLMINLTRCYQ